VNPPVKTQAPITPVPESPTRHNPNANPVTPENNVPQGNMTPNPSGTNSPQVRVSGRHNKGVPGLRYASLMEQLPRNADPNEPALDIAPALSMINSDFRSPPKPIAELPDPRSIDPSVVIIPRNLKEAMESDFVDYWAQAISKELGGIDRLDTFRPITVEDLQDDRIGMLRGKFFNI